MSSRKVLAYDAEPRAERLLTRTALVASAAPDGGVDHYLVSDRSDLDAVADHVDGPGAVGSRDVGKAGSRPATGHPEVYVVQRRGLQPDADLAGTRFGIGDLP